MCRNILYLEKKKMGFHIKLRLIKNKAIISAISSFFFIYKTVEIFRNFNIKDLHHHDFNPLVSMILKTNHL